ncbi:hypothetical protein LCGC14_1054750 [marine sediment metagenome]|uniref:Uncharacterized protein n=1 Tax=marine sediment metagenome TaxID=412755 RepID=A0A0F9MSB7_9ZZZZ
MSDECIKIKKEIAEIEKKWREDIKKPHGGGLSDRLNQKLIELRIKYRDCS